MMKVGNPECEWVGQFNSPKMRTNGVGHFGTPTEPQSIGRQRGTTTCTFVIFLRSNDDAYEHNTSI
jgi:hypothetical protein